MSNNNSSNATENTTEIVRQFVADLLHEEIKPGDICFNLIAVGMELGLATAPSPERAFALVSAALARVNGDRAPEPETDESEDLKEEQSADDTIGEPATLTIH